MAKRPIPMRSKIFNTADHIRRFWLQAQELAKIEGGENWTWHRQGERQAYRDSLECMKQHGLIADYTLDKITMFGKGE